MNNNAKVTRIIYLFILILFFQSSSHLAQSIVHRAI